MNFPFLTMYVCINGGMVMGCALFGYPGAFVGGLFGAYVGYKATKANDSHD